MLRRLNLKIKGMPQQFAADKFKTEQYFATSKDGTKVPYFCGDGKKILSSMAAIQHCFMVMADLKCLFAQRIQPLLVKTG